MFFEPSQPGENRGERLGEFGSRSVKTQGFQQAMEARTTCFIYFFMKLLFLVLTKRKTIYEARTVNSHNPETVKPHCSRNFRASQHYETTLVAQSKRTYYPNYFINVYVFLCVYKKIRASTFDILNPDGGYTHQNLGGGVPLDFHKPDPVLNQKWLDFDTLL